MRRALFAVVLLLLSACAGEDGGPAPAAAGPVVQVVDFAFDPAQVDVPVGGTVEWVYSEDGTSVHTVTFEDPAESGPIRPGERYSRTFDTPGTYSYVCFYHSQMTGTVRVSS